MATTKFKARVDHVEWGTTDLQSLKNFLSKLFGWKFEPFGETYYIYMTGTNDATVGLFHSTAVKIAGGTPTASVQVASINTTLKKAVKLGGGVITPKTLIAPEMGSFAVAAAPDGNLIGLFEKPSPKPKRKAKAKPNPKAK